MSLKLYLKCHHQTQSHLDLFPMLSSISFIVLHLAYRSMITFELIFVEDKNPLSHFFFFYMWLSVCSTSILLKTFFSSIALSLLLCQRSIDYTCVSLFPGSVFCPLICLFFLPIPHCLDYCSSTVKSGTVSPLTWFFSFNTVLAILSLPHHINFRIILLISTKELTGLLIEIVLNL